MPPAQTGRSNADDAYRAIRRLIVTVGIPPGEAFTEGELVDRIGIGKTPVREALLRLRTENLIIAQPRAGYRAAPVTLKDVRDTCRVLGHLEALTSEHAARSGTAHTLLRPLQTQVEQSAAADDERGGGTADGTPGDTPGDTADGTTEGAVAGTVDGWIRADWRFHLALARSQDNLVQADIMARLGESVLRFRYLALALGAAARTLVHGHDDLLDALAKADEAGAPAAVADIWDETESSLVAMLSTADSVQSANVAITRDRNAFYLDAAPPGPAIPDVFQSRLRPGTSTQSTQSPRPPSGDAGPSR
jgi:DNA-binding GntR family transcriptional regulator